jgi:hypothetical protein
MLDTTHGWWLLLRAVTALNVAAWLVAAWWCWRERGRWPPAAWLDRRAQLLLSAGYVLGCGWRSLLPVFDVPRLVMVDSALSSVIVGRSVATVAELCFAAQWALLLRAVASATGSAAGLTVSRLVLPLIALAESCSWYSVLTTSNIGHVVEESLWATVAVLFALSAALAALRIERRQRRLLTAWAVAGLLYAAYLFGVDVPMYWQRWLADQASGHGALSVVQGLWDASSRWVVSHRWEDWRSEVFWMTTYFSVAVWISISLALAPRFRRETATLATLRAA